MFEEATGYFNNYHFLYLVITVLIIVKQCHACILFFAQIWQAHTCLNSAWFMVRSYIRTTLAIAIYIATKELKYYSKSCIHRSYDYCIRMVRNCTASNSKHQLQVLLSISNFFHPNDTNSLLIMLWSLQKQPQLLENFREDYLSWGKWLLLWWRYSCINFNYPPIIHVICWNTINTLIEHIRLVNFVHLSIGVHMHL